MNSDAAQRASLSGHLATDCLGKSLSVKFDQDLSASLRMDYIQWHLWVLYICNIIHFAYEHVCNGNLTTRPFHPGRAAYERVSGCCVQPSSIDGDGCLARELTIGIGP
jgi:hypothetical protein